MENTERKNEIFANAMSNLMKDKFGMSIDLLNELIDADSDDKLAVLARGSVYLKMGDTKNAIGDFSRALEIDSKHPKAYHLRGLAHEMAGDNDKALNRSGIRGCILQPSNPPHENGSGGIGS